MMKIVILIGTREIPYANFSLPIEEAQHIFSLDYRQGQLDLIVISFSFNRSQNILNSIHLMKGWHSSGIHKYLICNSSYLITCSKSIVINNWAKMQN